MKTQIKPEVVGVCPTCKQSSIVQVDKLNVRCTECSYSAPGGKYAREIDAEFRGEQ